MEEPRDPATAPDPWADGPPWSGAPAADPWADLPGEADARAGEAGESSSPSEPTSPDDPANTTGSPEAAAAPAAGPACAWCGTTNPPDASKCSSCGAALAQRESIGDLVIPGLTAVDPALQDFANRPLHLSGPSPSHGVASSAVAAAAVGGPAGLAIIGGVAAVAAAEYLGANRAGGTSVEHVGRASDAVIQAVERLDRGEALPSADETTPRPELEATVPGPEPVTEEETADGGD
jgi:hypothetical protein